MDDSRDEEVKFGDTGVKTFVSPLTLTHQDTTHCCVPMPNTPRDESPDITSSQPPKKKKKKKHKERKSSNESSKQVSPEFGGHGSSGYHEHNRNLTQDGLILSTRAVTPGIDAPSRDVLSYPPEGSGPPPYTDAVPEYPGLATTPSEPQIGFSSRRLPFSGRHRTARGRLRTDSHTDLEEIRAPKKQILKSMTQQRVKKEMGSTIDKEAMADFMDHHYFHRMTCKRYCKDEAASLKFGRDLCGCGRAKEDLDHADLVCLDQVDTGFTQPWTPEEDAGAIKGDSNHFGTIAFKGFGQISAYQAPYICVGDDDNLDHLWEVIEDRWELPAPRLIVSVVGGAKRFAFDKSKTSQLFKRGLVEVATTSGAWIITPGTRTGVYKMIGEAISDYLNTVGNLARQDIVLMGITAWGSINNRSALHNKSDDAGRMRGLFPAEYRLTDLTTETKLASLDPNHSHFILVDDGTRDKFGGEIKWRVNFERFLGSIKRTLLDTQSDNDSIISAAPQTDSVDGNAKYVSVPVVTILVNGGDGSLENIAEILESDKPYPIVVIAGSGRAAEVVIRTIEIEKSNFNDVSLVEAYSSAMAGAPPSPSVKRHLTTIYNSKKFVTVFDFDRVSRTETTTGLDAAILTALYSHQEKITVETRKSQMNLALAWNKFDYLQTEILDINNVDYKEFVADKDFMNDILLSAIVQNLGEFVITLLDHGVDLAVFVTAATLEKLYYKSQQFDDAYARFANSLVRPKTKRHLCSSACCLLPLCGPSSSAKVAYDRSDLHHVGLVIQSLIGDFYPNEYEHVNQENYNACINPTDPAKHLFYWAVLYNRKELAKIFWKYTNDHIAGAIVGASLYRGLKDKSNHHEGIEITSIYSLNALEFEAMANGILSQCWARNRNLTSKMLIREEPNWGGGTLMSMADNAEMEEFLAQPACFTKLNKIWRGNLALRTSWWRISLFALFPFVFVFLLKYARRDNTDTRLDEIPLGTHKDRHDDEIPQLGAYRVECGGKSYDSISYWQAIYHAYQAPIVKFIYYIMWYVGFLVIYSLFVMHELAEFNYSIGVLEILTWSMCFINSFEEIRQIAHQDERRVLSKLKDWFSDFWNKLDAVSYIVFILAVILRFLLKGPDFQHVRWIYCLSLACFYLRFSQMFYVVENLGPKIIMIRKMMVDVLFFLFILMIVLCTFGVMYQAMLYPQTPINIELIPKIFSKPYWQMYGELFLEEVVDGDVPGCVNRTTHSLYGLDSNTAVCPEKTPVTAIMLVMYMILTNVLLLNLLIAMFSHTFEEVQGNATILWKYHYYGLVFENSDRPYIPPIGTIYKFIVRSCDTRFQIGSSRTLFRVKLKPATNKKITSLITVCMEIYLKQELRRIQEDVAVKVTSTAARLESVINQLDDLREDVLAFQTQSRPEMVDQQPGGLRRTTSASSMGHTPALNNRVHHVEKKLDRILELMQQQR